MRLSRLKYSDGAVRQKWQATRTGMRALGAVLQAEWELPRWDETHACYVDTNSDIIKASQRSSTPKIKGDVDATWGHDLHDADEAKSKGNRQAKENPLARTFKKDLLFEAATGRKSQDGTTSEISIRGKAGPYVVIGSNFAPGTTAADIESVMLPVGGEMQSCRIITATPTVMAEMVFLDTRNAEAVIGMFNNQKV